MCPLQGKLFDWTKWLPTSLLRFGQNSFLQACFDLDKFTACKPSSIGHMLHACLFGLDKLRWDKITISMHPSNPLAPRASCRLYLSQASFEPRDIFIQDLTKFLKEHPSIQKSRTSLTLKGNDSLYVCFDPHASIRKHCFLRTQSFDWAICLFRSKLQLGISFLRVFVSTTSFD